MLPSIIVWATRSLNRQFIASLTAGLLITSVVFLVLFIGLYRAQLEQERSAASTAVNRLLQAALENAMLKQDLDGLREIIQNMALQADIRQVSIINPALQIRFSSTPEILFKPIQWPKLKGQLPKQPFTSFIVNEQGHEVLRSVNPVYNQARCSGCHGDPTVNPVNGVLLVDYDAGSIRGKALYNGLLMVVAGSFVLLLAAGMLWWGMRRFVVKPVEHLAQVSQALADGDLSARARRDMLPNELGRLAQSFNSMATSLQHSLNETCEKEEFLQALIEAVPDGLRVVDRNYRVLLANRAHSEQLGLDMNTVLSKPCYVTSHGESQPCPPTLITCPLHEMRHSDAPVRSLSHYTREDGTDLYVEVHAAPMKLTREGHTITFVVESVRDLSQDIRFSHEQKLSALGQLAAGVAHEIYNPLSSVRLALQNTLKSLQQGTLDAARTEHYLKLVETQISECMEVTERMLKLSSVGGGKAGLVDVNAAIRETVLLLEYESQEKGIQIRLDLTGDECRVVAHDHDVRMVVLNLVQNAFHAMPQGGQLDITSRVEAEQVYLRVKDTGTGIRPEQLPYIFHPFFSRRADSPDGSGLGLSICKNLLKQYGGGIEVKTQWQSGSEFIVHLPLASRKTRP